MAPSRENCAEASILERPRYRGLSWRGHSRRRKSGGAKAMPEGDKDQQCPPSAVPISLGSLDQRLDFATRIS
jgi:hypothetical protein